MQVIKHSTAFSRKRRFLLILPAFVVPFLIIIFYLLGGGKAKSSAFSGIKRIGLNLQLPDAHFFDKKERDKLSLYEASNRDSDMKRMALRNDPYRSPKDTAIKSLFEKTSKDYPAGGFAVRDSLIKIEPTAAKERELMEKLNRLKEQLSKPGPGVPDLAKIIRQPETHEALISERLKNEESVSDPEIGQLSKMLDKVMAIQHPEMIRDSLTNPTATLRSLVYSVSLNNDSDDPVNFGSPEVENRADSGETNRFYELANNQASEDLPDNAIKAFIPENQTLVSGSTIKLQLASDLRINGHLVRSGQLIYGTCSLNNERLKIQFSSIRAGNSILPVSLQAYDLDGLAGIYIPGSISRDAAKQSGDQAINGLGLATLDPSIGAQAASASIQTAKTLLSRKVKLVKVTVKAGYEVLLRDDRK